MSAATPASLGSTDSLRSKRFNPLKINKNANRTTSSPGLVQPGKRKSIEAYPSVRAALIKLLLVPKRTATSLIRANDACSGLRSIGPSRIVVKVGSRHSGGVDGDTRKAMLRRCKKQAVSWRRWQLRKRLPASSRDAVVAFAVADNLPEAACSLE